MGAPVIAVGNEALKQLGTQRYEKLQACRDSKPGLCDTDAVDAATKPAENRPLTKFSGKMNWMKL